MTTLKIMTLGECCEAMRLPQTAEFHMVINTALWQTHNLPMPCLTCGQPLGGNVAYVALVLPEHEEELAATAGVCARCGMGPRSDIERAVAQLTVLHLVPIAGHA